MHLHGDTKRALRLGTRRSTQGAVVAGLARIVLLCERKKDQGEHSRSLCLDFACKKCQLDTLARTAGFGWADIPPYTSSFARRLCSYCPYNKASEVSASIRTQSLGACGLSLGKVPPSINANKDFRPAGIDDCFKDSPDQCL